MNKSKLLNIIKNRIKLIKSIHTKSIHNNNLIYIENIITKNEEEELIKFLNPLLLKRKYESNHWDNVINKYKEIELLINIKNSKIIIPENVINIINNVKLIISEHTSLKNNDYLHPHVIDLDDDGNIGSHIDSIKFSGTTIAGLSLLSSRVLLLKLDKTTLNNDHSNNDNLKNEIEILVNPRSLYILKDIYRYNYSHAILGKNDTNNNYNIDIKRRISIMFRNNN